MFRNQSGREGLSAMGDLSETHFPGQMMLGNSQDSQDSMQHHHHGGSSSSAFAAAATANAHLAAETLRYEQEASELLMALVVLRDSIMA